MRPKRTAGQPPPSQEMTVAELDYVAQASQMQSVCDSVAKLRTEQEFIRQQAETFQAQNEEFRARLLE